jgi:hypothetical protein
MLRQRNQCDTLHVMADTSAPPGASAETEELVTQLRDLYDRRRQVLDDIRRGPGHADRDAILLELCGFRGMQYTEAAAAIGYTREGVARRVRPQLDALGLTGLSLFERQTAAGIDRPLKDSSVEDLRAALRPSRSGAVSKREAAAQARQLRKDMLKVMDRLHKAGMTWVDMAERLGVSVPTIQRLRGRM